MESNIQETLQISNEKMVEYYEYAQELFADKRYQDAADILLFLSTINPYVYEVWLARGVAEYSLQNFTESVYAFQMAIALDRHREDAYLGLIQVFKEQGQELAAKEIWEFMRYEGQ